MSRISKIVEEVPVFGTAAWTDETWSKMIKIAHEEGWQFRKPQGDIRYANGYKVAQSAGDFKHKGNTLVVPALSVHGVFYIAIASTTLFSMKEKTHFEQWLSRAVNFLKKVAQDPDLKDKVIGWK